MATTKAVADLSASRLLLSFSMLVILQLGHSSAGEDDLLICKELRVLKVGRSAAKSGYHRELITTIHLSSDITRGNCRLMYKEYFPWGAYVDMDQLKNEAEFGGPKVFCNESINVELPADRAPMHTLWVYPDTESIKEALDVVVKMPIHLRYHQPNGSQTSALVPLQPPKLFINCREPIQVTRCEFPTISVPCTAEQQMMCEWTQIPLSTDNELDTLHVHVPLGPTEHTSLVTKVTTLSSIGGIIWILVLLVLSPS